MASLITCALLTDIAGEPVRVTDPPARSADPLPETGETLQLAFAGDVHFAGDYAEVPSIPGSTLGPMSAVLREADLAMVNLESAVTLRDQPTRKEREDPSNRYWFRAGRDALDLLDRSGVDVVSVANNHGADYGLSGVRDTIRAGEASAVSLVGIGRNDRAAFAPHRVSVKGTDIAVHAADASPRESDDAIWAASPGSGPGIAAARGPGRVALLEAVRESARTDDLVIVYLHWGEEGNACSTASQEGVARTLAAYGADIVVGTHAHTPLGAGMLGSTYVSYGLGNFYWYHGREPETGVLRLAVNGDQVVGDEWVPAEIRPGGGSPRPLSGSAGDAAVREWQGLRGCTDLAPGPGPVKAIASEAGEGGTLPGFASSINRIDASVRRGMRHHDPQVCPVPLADLRHLEVTHVGFDGRAHRGELMVHEDVAEDIVEVFAALYDDRFPIRRMLLIDEYAGDDNASMAANNTSGYNCRRVAGQSTWSDHAYGRAIDINPVQNPYVVGGDVRPPAASRYVSVDRSENAPSERGVIRDGDVVRKAFERLGWEWGGDYPDPDFQHFSAPE